MAYEKELELARRLARQAAEVALAHRSRGLTAESKLDRSLVTAADRECERLIAAALEEVFPEDGLIGEEGALKPSRSGRRWIVDPIDGTLDYLRRIPTWSVLLALETSGDAPLGVCYLAEQDEMHFAVRGQGAFVNDQPLRASAIAEAGRALLCINSLHRMREWSWSQRLPALMSAFSAVRSFGGCQDAMMVASGRAEAWIEPYAYEWDLAPLKVIAEEAGAVFFNFDGGASIYGGNCVIVAPGLADLLRAFLREP